MIKGSLVVRAQRFSTSAFIEGPFCRRCVIVVSPAIDGSETFRDNPPGLWGPSKGPRNSEGPPGPAISAVSQKKRLIFPQHLIISQSKGSERAHLPHSACSLADGWESFVRQQRPSDCGALRGCQSPLSQGRSLTQSLPNHHLRRAATVRGLCSQKKKHLSLSTAE